MGKKAIKIEAKNDTVNVFMYGYIDSWEVSGKKLIDQLTGYEGKYQNCNIYVNSNGGDVLEGIALFSILSRTSLELSIHIDGVAASMAAVLVQVPGAKRYMSRHAKMMLHSVSGGAWGSADKLRNVADQMDDFQKTLVQIVSDRTGMGKRAVKTKWFDNKDHWFNADDALEAGLIDEITDGKVNDEPANLNNLADVIDFYGKQIQNFNNKNETTMDLTGFINALQLPAGSTEDKVLDAIKAQASKIAQLDSKVKNLEQKNGELLDKVKQADEDRIASMVDAAIAAKKITAGQKEMYVSLAKADFDNTKKVLDAMQGYQSIGGQLQADGNAPVKLSDEEKKYTFVDFLKKAPAKLQAIKEKTPEMYKQLYKEEYGKEPTNQ